MTDFMEFSADGVHPDKFPSRRIVDLTTIIYMERYKHSLYIVTTNCEFELFEFDGYDIDSLYDDISKIIGAY